MTTSPDLALAIAELMNDPPLDEAVVSNSLLDNPKALRERLKEQGYLYLQHLLDPLPLLTLRHEITAILRDKGWLDHEADPKEAVGIGEIPVEGEPRYFEVYDEIQRLELFHALPHDMRLMDLMRRLLGERAYPHPLLIARLMYSDNMECTTPPHQDFPNNQGTPDLYTTWIPIGDCPKEMGPIAVIPGSHRVGVLPLEFSLGSGHRRSMLPEALRGKTWVTSNFSLGDVFVFHSLTVHRSLLNRSRRRFRISVDFRYQREGEPMTENCLFPQFKRQTWGEIYKHWKSRKYQYYWKKLELRLAPWDRALHELPEDHLPAAAFRKQMFDKVRAERAGE
jgi:hypothetical protein